MGSYRSLCVPIDSNRSLWVPLDSYASLRILMDPYRFLEVLCIFMDSNGSLVFVPFFKTLKLQRSIKYLRSKNMEFA